MYYLCSENKGAAALISFAVKVKLNCIFVFTYAKCLLSHDAAHMFFNEYFEPKQEKLYFRVFQFVIR